jgi:predicted permease
MWTPLRQCAARLHAIFSRGALDQEFEQEIEAHLGMLTDEYVRRGMTPDHARRAAAVRIGNAQSLKMQHRDARAWPSLDALGQDLRFAIRLLLKDRRFAAAAIIALALGIGANATGFMIVNAAFFRQLPFESADELYMLSWQTTRSNRTADLTAIELQEWRTRTTSFDIAAFAETTVNISDDASLPQYASATWVTANSFNVLKQSPLVGRNFVPADEQPGAAPVVILGYRIWRDRYGANPLILGNTLRLNGRPTSIIGVMPDGMRFPEDAELWAPFIPSDGQHRRDARQLTAFGRLTPQIDRRQAYAELDGIARQMLSADPHAPTDLVGAAVETFNEAFVGDTARGMFITIMWAVGFVLLIACANVGNLLLARSASRAREIALRVAMGATRARVIRQLLIEGLLLAVLGGSVGLLIAVAGVQLFEAAMQDSQKPYWMVFTLDSVVFGYVAALSVGTTLLFALAPALQVTRTNSHEVLKEGGRGMAGNRRVRWFSSTMVVAECALTIVLLAGAGFTIRSFLKLYTVEVGVSDRLMTMRLQLPEETYPTESQRRLFFNRLESRLAAVDGVESVAITTGVPPFDGGERLVDIERAVARDVRRPRFVSTVIISPRFFEVVERPVIRGRGFSDVDGGSGLEVAVINEQMAADFFPDEDPIGQRLRFTSRQPADGPPDVWRTIVGVSAAIRHGSVQDRYRNAVVYLPYRQDAPRAVSLLVRSALSPAVVTDALRRQVHAIDRDQPVYDVQTIQQAVAADRWPHRVFGGLFAILALIAIALSSVGLYGVTSYSVAQRTQEIGVRVAVGARRGAIAWLVVKRSLLQLAVAVPIGLAGAVALGIALEGLLVEMTPVDTSTFAAVLCVIAVVALAACIGPARRAMRVDPIDALRAD